MTANDRVEQAVACGAAAGLSSRWSSVIMGGRGSLLITEDGRELLDFTSGIGVNALGYGDPGIADRDQQRHWQRRDSHVEPVPHAAGATARRAAGRAFVRGSRVLLQFRR